MVVEEVGHEAEESQRYSDSDDGCDSDFHVRLLLLNLYVDDQGVKDSLVPLDCLSENRGDHLVVHGLVIDTNAVRSMSIKNRANDGCRVSCREYQQTSLRLRHR